MSCNNSLSNSGCGCNNPYFITADILRDVLQNEQESIARCRRLIELTENEENRGILRSIVDDDLRHYNDFANLFTRLTGQSPRLLRTQTDLPEEFLTGLKNEVLEKLEDSQLYRDILLSNSNADVRRTCFIAMTDDNGSAAKCNLIICNTLEKDID